MGDPSVEVSEADREGALVQKAMAMDAAFLEGRRLFNISVVILAQI